MADKLRRIGMGAAAIVAVGALTSVAGPAEADSSWQYRCVPGETCGSDPGTDRGRFGRG